jgi:hypothetical protein
LRITVRYDSGRIKEFTAGCHNHGTHLQGCSTRFVIITDGIGHAEFLTQTASDADIPVDNVRQRYRLGIFNICGASETQGTVKFVGCSYRAFKAALSATGTFYKIYVTGSIDQCGDKMSG